MRRLLPLIVLLSLAVVSAPSWSQDTSASGSGATEQSLDLAASGALNVADNCLEVSEEDTNADGVEAKKKCCKICTKGKACGDTCIARSKTCHKGPGCACDG